MMVGQTSLEHWRPTFGPRVRFPPLPHGWNKLEENRLDQEPVSNAGGRKTCGFESHLLRIVR